MGYVVSFPSFKKIRNLHENTKAMGFKRSIFHYYTQITPLENGGQKICIVSPTPDLKTKDSKFRPEQLMRTGLETNNSKFSLEPLYCEWNELLLLFIPNKSPPWKGDQEICMVYPPFSSQKWVLKTKILKFRPEPLMRTWNVLVFPSKPHKSPLWKTGATQFEYITS